MISWIRSTVISGQMMSGAQRAGWTLGDASSWVVSKMGFRMARASLFCAGAHQLGDGPGTAHTSGQPDEQRRAAHGAHNDAVFDFDVARLPWGDRASYFTPSFVYRSIIGPHGRFVNCSP